jgi:hypothetical protein
LRREVIGQILEYAANFSASWSADRVRSAYERTASTLAADAAQSLETALALQPGTYEGYWQLLQANLDQQRLRLAIVADKIPLETLRIVEYLNRQMINTDIFCVSISQFIGGDVRTLNSRVLNPSVTETQRKSASSRAGAPWTRARFYDALLSRESRNAVSVMERIESWAAPKPHVEISFGSGVQDGSLQIAFRANPGMQAYRTGSDVVFLTLWTYGSVEVELQYLANFGPFRNEAVRRSLVAKLNELGCGLSEDSIRKRPNLSWEFLADQEHLERFLEIQDWVVETASQSMNAPQL